MNNQQELDDLQANFPEVKKFRVVTPAQLAQGYYERCGEVVINRRYKVLRFLPNNNYVVEEPVEKPLEMWRETNNQEDKSWH